MEDWIDRIDEEEREGERDKTWKKTIEGLERVAIGEKMKEIEQETKERREERGRVELSRMRSMRRRGFADSLTKFSSIVRPRPIFVIQQELEEAKYVRRLISPRTDQDYAAIELWKMCQKLELKLFKGFWFGGWLISNKAEDKFVGVTFEARTAFKKRGKREITKARLEAGGIKHISFKGDIEGLEGELREAFEDGQI